VLKKRITTAAIILPLAIAGIWYLPPPAFKWILGLIFIIVAHEWTQLIGLKRPLIRVLATVALMLSSLFFEKLSLLSLSNIGLGFWLVAFIGLIGYPANKKFLSEPLVGGIVAAFTLIPAWLALSAIQAQGPEKVLYLLAWVCLADTGAYFAGKRFGRHLLAAQLSPGKTWEGLAGALLAVFLINSIFAWGFGIGKNFWSLQLMGCITVLISIIGDLWESLFKRNQRLKDSGRILPGHGGLADRLDSLMAASPMLLFGLLHGFSF